MMKKLIILVMTMLLLAGCNTWKGFGQDLEEAGEAIQKK
ncbi:MAG TPA: entericidin A/B family lipoprotein [Methylophilaceae bacterium]|nr:entericidin A/B family lipoprotein [Methylophilaceae bacterium]